MNEVYKNIIKRIIPSFVVDIYRLHGKTIFYYKRIVGMKKIKDYSILLGTPVHENLGDHLITVAELKFLHDLNVGCVIEIPIEAYKLFKRKIKQVIDSDVNIYVQGGGWMGTMWPCDELLIQDMLSSFDTNRIIVFPQTSFYDCKSLDYAQLVASGRNVYKKENVFVCLREYESYTHFKKIFPGAKINLQPDITLYLKKRNTCRNDGDNSNNLIGICFRNDRENSKCNLKQAIMEYLNEAKLDIDYVDTIAKYDVKEVNREKAIQKKLDEFGKYDLIITDRLHGMIFSYLAGTKCIAMDNKSHKVRSVYKTWMMECNEIEFIEDFDEFLCKLESIQIHSEEKTYDFHLLKELVCNGTN